METIDKDEFLKLYLLDDMKFDLISSKFGIKKTMLSEWWENRNMELHDLIQKSNQKSSNPNSIKFK